MEQRQRALHRTLHTKQRHVRIAIQPTTEKRSVMPLNVACHTARGDAVGPFSLVIGTA